MDIGLTCGHWGGTGGGVKRTSELTITLTVVLLPTAGNLELAIDSYWF